MVRLAQLSRSCSCTLLGSRRADRQCITAGRGKGGPLDVILTTGCSPNTPTTTKVGPWRAHSIACVAVAWTPAHSRIRSARSGPKACRNVVSRSCSVVLLATRRRQRRSPLRPAPPRRRGSPWFHHNDLFHRSLRFRCKTQVSPGVNCVEQAKETPRMSANAPVKIPPQGQAVPSN